jgi:hypothetical protein
MAVKYYPHHFIFALPLFVLLFVLAARLWMSEDGNETPIALWAMLLPSSLFLLLHPVPLPLWTLVFTGSPIELRHREVASRFDALMDRCGYDRYLSYGWELEDLWTHTRHSPYGSSLTNLQWNLDRTVPSFTDRFVERLNATSVIVIQDERIPQLDEETQGQLLPAFTDQPPACAKEFLPIGEYVVLFRK